MRCPQEFNPVYNKCMIPPVIGIYNKLMIVKIIRRHIQVNKTLPPAPFEINIKYLSMAIDRFVKAIKNKRWESKGVPHRFDKLNSFYELAFKDFSNAVLDCYKSSDRNHGDYNLYHLDTNDIVNKAFTSVFLLCSQVLLKKVINT